MQRGLAVLVIMAGAAIAWAGYSDNTIINTFSAPFNTSVKLNKGAAGLDKVVAVFTVYLAAKIAGSAVAGALGGIGALGGGGGSGGGETPVPETPVPELAIEPIPLSTGTGAKGTLV